MVVHVSRDSTGRRFVSEVVEIPSSFSGQVRHLFNGGEVTPGIRTRVSIQ
jgi:hypothetical protein